MSATDIIRVALGERSYDICVGQGLLSEAGERIRPFVRRQPVIIVTDRNVAALHLDTLRSSLARAGIQSAQIVLDPGEGTKVFSGFEKLVNAILDLRPERSSLIVALGGGVIGDLAGFAASVVLRGIDFVQIPTTLLSQVDSSVGGKTGIDTRHGKNLIGSFYQPRLVLADMATLETLPPRELRAGYAEVVKYGLLGDAAFFQWLEKNGLRLIEGDAEARRYAVTASCRAKAAIVSEDEREAGRRALLNLGHTFGHALEAETGFGSEVLHGEAVAIGMTMAFDLSVRLGFCPAEDAARVRRHLAACGLPTGLDALPSRSWRTDRLIGHMRQDKKVRDGQISFVLVRGIGQAFVAREVDIAEVEALLQRSLAA